MENRDDLATGDQTCVLWLEMNLWHLCTTHIHFRAALNSKQQVWSWGQGGLFPSLTFIIAKYLFFSFSTFVLFDIKSCSIKTKEKTQNLLCHVEPKAAAGCSRTSDARCFITLLKNHSGDRTLVWTQPRPSLPDPRRKSRIKNKNKNG